MISGLKRPQESLPMKRSRLTETQIVSILREYDAGGSRVFGCRVERLGVSHKAEEILIVSMES